MIWQLWVRQTIPYLLLVNLCVCAVTCQHQSQERNHDVYKNNTQMCVCVLVYIVILLYVIFSVDQEYCISTIVIRERESVCDFLNKALEQCVCLGTKLGTSALFKSWNWHLESVIIFSKNELVSWKNCKNNISLERS